MDPLWITSDLDPEPDYRDVETSGSLEVTAETCFSGNSEVLCATTRENDNRRNFIKSCAKSCTYCQAEREHLSQSSNLNGNDYNDAEGPILSSSVTIEIDVHQNCDESGVDLIACDLDNSDVNIADTSVIQFSSHRSPPSSFTGRDELGHSRLHDLASSFSDADDECSTFAPSPNHISNREGRRLLDHKLLREGIGFRRERLQATSQQLFAGGQNMDRFRRALNHFAFQNTSSSPEAAFVARMTTTKHNNSQKPIEHFKRIIKSVTGSSRRSRHQGVLTHKSQTPRNDNEPNQRLSVPNMSSLMTIKAVSDHESSDGESSASLSPRTSMDEQSSLENTENVGNTIEIHSEHATNSKPQWQTWEEHLLHDLNYRGNKTENSQLMGPVDKHDDNSFDRQPSSSKTSTTLTSTSDESAVTVQSAQEQFIVLSSPIVAPNHCSAQDAILPSDRTCLVEAATEIKTTPVTKQRKLRRIDATSELNLQSHNPYSRLHSTTTTSSDAPSVSMTENSLTSSLSCPLLPLSAEIGVNHMRLPSSSGRSTASLVGSYQHRPSDLFVDENAHSLWGRYGDRLTSDGDSCKVCSQDKHGHEAFYNTTPSTSEASHHQHHSFHASGNDHDVSMHPLTTRLVPGLQLNAS